MGSWYRTRNAIIKVAMGSLDFRNLFMGIGKTLDLEFTEEDHHNKTF